MKHNIGGEHKQERKQRIDLPGRDRRSGLPPTPPGPIQARILVKSKDFGLAGIADPGYTTTPPPEPIRARILLKIKRFWLGRDRRSATCAQRWSAHNAVA